MTEWNTSLQIDNFISVNWVESLFLPPTQKKKNKLRGAYDKYGHFYW